MANTKWNVYNVVLQKVCEKFNGAEEYIKKKLKSYVTKKNYQQKR